MALAGILTFSDKIIDKEDAKKIKEVMMMMTKVEKLIRDEAYAEGFAKGLAEARTEVLTKALRKDIIELLSDNGTVSDNLKAEIQALTDKEILKSWLKAAAKAESIEAFQEMIKA